MIQENIKQVQSNMMKAAAKANKKVEDITLIAVSKTYPIDAVEEAIQAGCKHFGENKVQELQWKIPLVPENIQWHMIGHLQTNKVKYIVGKVALIHSVDSIKLAKEIQKHSQKHNVTTSILLEVNVANEASKAGIQCEEVISYVQEIAKLPNVQMKGLMTVAPYVENPEQNRIIFRKLYDLSVDIQKQKLNNISTDILSMGMSNDYEVAIEEGATMVRVGTDIFGKRNYAI